MQRSERAATTCSLFAEGEEDVKIDPTQETLSEVIDRRRDPGRPGVQRLAQHANRTLSHYENLAREIAALREARKWADRAIQLRHDMLAVVAHELRDPLQTIAANTALLHKPQLAEEQWARVLGILQRTAQRMERLISELLDVSRMEADGFAIARAPVDVQALLADACEQFEAQARERGVELMCDAPDLPTVTGDRGHNLDPNGTKTSPTGHS